VHSSTLLDALIALFDIYWERATPIVLDDAPGPDGHRGLDQETVLSLLASGLKDEAIASELGVSTQTVRRRITELQRRHGVTTRFQLGLALAPEGMGRSPE
jgi:response regulator of citrate/malate metabolism